MKTKDCSTSSVKLRKGGLHFNQAFLVLHKWFSLVISDMTLVNSDMTLVNSDMTL